MGTISAITQCPGGGHIFVEVTMASAEKVLLTIPAEEVFDFLRPRSREERLTAWVLQQARVAKNAGATTRTQLRTALLGQEFVE